VQGQPGQVQLEPSRRVRRWAVRGAISLAVIVVLWLGLCYQVVENPTVVTHPGPADAIVVLGPATSARTDAALALARQGLSHVLVLSNATTHQHATQVCNHPPAGWSVTCFVPEPGTTRGEAEYVRDLAARYGWTNLIVVTSRFHISRARLILKRCLSGEVQLVAAPESISVGQWLYQYAYQSAGYVRAALHTDC
jgi:uncharacterized SAM-binding protein YcdF (DUF218 family)